MMLKLKGTLIKYLLNKDQPIKENLFLFKLFKMLTIKENNNLSENILEPPDNIIGMKILDRDKISKIIHVPCIEIDTINLTNFLKLASNYLLKLKNLESVKTNNSISSVLINPICFEKLNLINDFKKITEKNIIKKIYWKKLELTYENFNFLNLIRKILKNESFSFSSFTIIGHIIHLNLKNELVPYKNIIGEMLLDKNSFQTIVLNKISKINSVYRNFEFEVLAKKNEYVNTIVITKENKYIYKFDFSEVYWNPRLSTEHQRVIKLISHYDIVFDVFAGIGPFSIPAAKKKKCKVFANDLNPKSYMYLKENIILNQAYNIETFNLDGRQFIKEIIKTNLEKEWIKRYDKFELSGVNFHILMNLPASAVEFLDEFVNLFKNFNNEIIQKMYLEDKLILPIIYCYTFSHSKENEILCLLIEKKLDFKVKNIDVFFVRNVAPLKNMFRLRFTLPKEVLFGKETFKKLKTI